MGGIKRTHSNEDTLNERESRRDRVREAEREGQRKRCFLRKDGKASQWDANVCKEKQASKSDRKKGKWKWAQRHQGKRQFDKLSCLFD